MGYISKSMLNCCTVAIGLAFAAAAPASAQSVGNTGIASANGVVTAPPIGGDYRYVSTNGGVTGGGSLALGAETNGSLFESASFAANVGSVLEFYFNYVTSDGAGFADYAWAGLRPTSAADLILFTARTTPTGNTVPGFELPDLAPGVVLDPPSTPIIAGGPVWAQLGGSSGECWRAGCGYTGWIKMTYTIEAAGNYNLLLGVTNWDDTNFQSGLAFAGLTIDSVPIDPPGAVPEPGTWAMMILGFGAVGGAMRSRRRNRVSVSYA